MRLWKAKFLCSLLVATTVSSSVNVTASSNTPAFTDIDHSYAKDAIIRLIEQGIVEGVDATHFDPKGFLTRSQFVTMLARALQLPTEPAASVPTPFTDVQGWAVPYIASAYYAGFIDGVGQGEFRPDGVLTREQAAKMLVAALGQADPSIKIDEDAVPPFSDADRMADWAKPHIALAAELGFIQGLPDGSFDPKGNATREMAAVMSVNFLDKLEAVDDEVPAASAPTPDSAIVIPAPADLTAANVTNTGLTLNWEASADASVTEYDIYMGWDGNKVGTTSATSYEITGLTPGRRYSYFVRARDAQGNTSGKSNTYIATTLSVTSLTIQPEFNGFFPLDREQPITVFLSGQISQADLQRKAKLYATFHNITSKDITLGTIAGLGQPEVVQEGAGSQPLIVAWGVPQGFELHSYLLSNSFDLHMNFQIPVTMHTTAFIRAQLDLKTADAADGSELASVKFLLQGGQSFLQPADFKLAVTAMLEQPLPAQAGQRITIPVTIKGTVPTEYLTDLSALQLRILDQQNILDPDEVTIEDVSGFGHPDVVFNAKDYLEIQFDRYTRLEDLQQALSNGISFNLNITLRQAGSFGMFASLGRVDEKGRTIGAIGGGNVISVIIE